ncbi:hypothetical protein EON80_00480 [bacterium]|nr:MAG: hypothetical protein EON80_00480 [bacterium]
MYKYKMYKYKRRVTQYCGSSIEFCENSSSNMNLSVKSLIGRIFRQTVRNEVHFRKKGRDVYVWREGDYASEIFAEMLADDFVEIYSFGQDGWLAPHHNEKMSSEERERIVRDFCEYLTRQGIEYRFARMFPY